MDIEFGIQAHLASVCMHPWAFTEK